MSDLESLREKVLGKYLTEDVEISSKEYKNLSQQKKKGVLPGQAIIFITLGLIFPPKRWIVFLL